MANAQCCPCGKEAAPCLHSCCQQAPRRSTVRQACKPRGQPAGCHSRSMDALGVRGGLTLLCSFPSHLTHEDHTVQVGKPVPWSITSTMPPSKAPSTSCTGASLGPGSLLLTLAMPLNFKMPPTCLIDAATRGAAHRLLLGCGLHSVVAHLQDKQGNVYARSASSARICRVWRPFGRSTCPKE